jgi:hypothetical protein
MASRSLSRTKPKDYRPALIALARYYAREEVKARIRRSGKKISDYYFREIAAMADRMLEEEPELVLPKARTTIAAWMIEDQRRLARRRAARVFAKLQEIERSARRDAGAEA